MDLSIVPDSFAVCRLAATEEVPAWAWRYKTNTLFSITYTAEELSIVCPATLVPAYVRAERPWAALKVRGPLDFALVGILSSLAAPLAAGGIAIFALSTFDTDYVLLKESELARARMLLEQAGHHFM